MEPELGPTAQHLRTTRAVRPAEPPTEAEQSRQRVEGWLYPGVTVVLGLALGLAVPDDNSLELPPSALSRASAVIGWTYFVAWSLTFYPQVLSRTATFCSA